MKKVMVLMFIFIGIVLINDIVFKYFNNFTEITNVLLHISQVIIVIIFIKKNRFPLKKYIKKINVT